MFRLKSLARIEVHIVHDDMIMHMGVVYMDGKHILILVIEKCLAKFLTDKQSPFGSYLTGGRSSELCAGTRFGFVLCRLSV